MKKLLTIVLLAMTLVAQATNLTIGTGSGTLTQTSMGPMVAGHDTLFILTGSYTGQNLFQNLHNIVIAPSGGDVTFTGSNYTEVNNCDTIRWVPANGHHFFWTSINSDAFLFTSTHTEQFYVYNAQASGVVDNFFDMSGYGAAYVGTTASLKAYRVGIFNSKFTSCGEIWQGFYGTPSQNLDVADSITMLYDTVVQTASNGTEVAGPVGTINMGWWNITYTGSNPNTGDVGVFQVAGDGRVHDCYFKGGRGYLFRELGYGTGGVGSFYAYNNIIYGQNAYGGGDYRSDSSNYGSTNPYMSKCNAWFYNWTMGNKTDINSYVCPVLIIGTVAANGGNGTVTIRNMFAFNNQYGANEIVNNNSNSSWPGSDTANDVYATATYALSFVQDTSTTFMPLSSSFLNTNGAAISGPPSPIPDIYGYNGSTNRVGAVFYNPGSGPTCNAGTAQRDTLPNTLTLNGTGSTGTITSYAWSRASGPNTPTITSPTASTTTVTGLIPGDYVFTLTLNGTTSCNVADTIVAHTPPLVSVSANQTIMLPTNSVTISGSAVTYQGTTVSSYSWAKTGGTGTSYTITSPTAASTTVTGMGVGTFFFTLTVTDSYGSTGTAVDTITVNASVNSCNSCVNSNASSGRLYRKGYTKVFVGGPSADFDEDDDTLPKCIKPTINTGGNQVIMLPANTATLSASALAHNGEGIKTYQWIQVNGTTVNIISANNPTTNVTGFSSPQVDSFAVTVTDSCGSPNTAYVIVTVLPEASPILNIVPNSASATFTVTVNATSSNGIWHYGWGKLTGPGKQTISGAYGKTATISGLELGTYVFKVTVWDSLNNISADTVTFTVGAQPKR